MRLHGKVFVKKLLFVPVFVTALFALWVGVSGAYSFSDACGGVVWYATHPHLISETCTVIYGSTEHIWSGWAPRIGYGRALYISYDFPTLVVVCMWALSVVAVLHGKVLLLIMHRKIVRRSKAA